MSTTIVETFDRERMRAGLTAGAATVGRPTGVEGKNRTPRRAKMTSKEVDHIKTRAGIKAGGPGSGRRPNEGSGRNNYKSLYKKLENQTDDGIFHTLDKADIPLKHKIEIGKRFGIDYYTTK